MVENAPILPYHRANGARSAASDFVAYFDAIASTGEDIDVILYARVSARSQATREDFEVQKHRLLEVIRRYPNVHVITHQLDIASGRPSQLHTRSGLQTAILAARLRRTVENHRRKPGRP